VAPAADLYLAPRRRETNPASETPRPASTNDEGSGTPAAGTSSISSALSCDTAPVVEIVIAGWPVPSAVKVPIVYWPNQLVWNVARAQIGPNKREEIGQTGQTARLTLSRRGL
jgi:hypothetical protein